MVKYCDVIVDLQSGDTGKGKVAHTLLKSGEYDLAMRYNGGSNAGHTIYHNGKKIVTHQVPAGVLHGIKSLIGIGCVVNIQKLISEIAMLNDNGIQTEGLIYVDRRAHIVTGYHLQDDESESQSQPIGTTKQGIGPAYTDKYARTGTRIGDLDVTFNDSVITKTIGNTFTIVDSMDLLAGASVLAEGAQGFNLDIDWGDYPYVTSSHCTAGSVCLNGVSPRKIRKIYGVAKAYETYVGAKQFGSEDCQDLLQVQIVGKEFGSTTGRKRKCNWINLDTLAYAANVNDITDLIINKIDVLDEVNSYCYIEGTDWHDAKTRIGLMEAIAGSVSPDINIIFSSSPDTI